MSFDNYDMLCQAVCENDTQKVNFLLTEMKVDPNSSDPIQISVFHLACLCNNLDIVRLFITNTLYPANPNNWAKVGVTIFHDVWSSRNMDMIALPLNESLIKVNLEYTFPHRGTNYMYTPLTQAIMEDNVQLVEMLLKAGADPNRKPHQDGSFPLVVAVLKLNIDICRVLLEHGHGCNYWSRYYTISTAVYVGDLQIMQVLLKHSSDIVKIYSNQRCFLQNAIKNNNSDVLECLMHHAYNLMGDKVSWGWTLLDEAIDHKSESCIAVLLYYGIYTYEGVRFKFYLAANRGLLSTMKILKELDPFCLQEEWLVKGKIPRSLLQYNTFTAELTKARKQPPNLDILCRSKIIQQLGYNPFEKAEQLPLPRPLREFVQLRNVIKLHQ